jgi:26S proteasome regulatory subunit N8
MHLYNTTVMIHRDVKDNAVSSLANDVQHKLLALRSLQTHLQEMEAYLGKVVAGELPINHQIISQIQDIFNLIPNLNIGSLVRSFAIKTNDMMLAIYLASIIRSIIALHNLINNKISNRKLEQKAEASLASEEQQAQELEEMRTKLKDKQQRDKDAASPGSSSDDAK